MKAFCIDNLIAVLVVIVIIGMVLLMSFAGCMMWRASCVTEGVVVERTFIPEHVKTTTTYHEINDITIPITSSHVVPDTYIVKIEGKYEDKVYVRTLHVDKISYQMLRTGDYLKVEDLPLTPKAEIEN